MDQDALNFVCDNLWKKLDSRWNFQDHHDKSLVECKAGIVHFVKRLKPWLASAGRLNAGFYRQLSKSNLFLADSFGQATRLTFAPLGRRQERRGATRFCKMKQRRIAVEVALRGRMLRSLEEDWGS